jgi:ribosomal protein L16 Arg81 hydroxylase
MVEPDAPDYTKYPGLHYVEAQEGVLEPGDALFMPSGYWHYISYLDAGYSVSYRKMPQNIQDGLKGLVNLTIKLPLDKFLTAVVGKSYYQFKVKLAVKRAQNKIEALNKTENKVAIAQ